MYCWQLHRNFLRQTPSSKTRVKLVLPSWVVLFDNLHCWLKLVCFNFCIIIYSFVCQSLFTTIVTTIIRRSRPVVLYKSVFWFLQYLKRNMFWSLVLSCKFTTSTSLNETPAQVLSCEFLKNLSEFLFHRSF